MMRARGDGFFAVAETLPYQPRGVLLSQETDDSCVAACCRMLLFDQSPHLRYDYHYSESFLREALRTDTDGSTISLVPDVLRDFGLETAYVYRRDLAIEALREFTQPRPAIAIVRAANTGRFHALIVEEVSDEFVAIRDPLMEGQGAAYKVSIGLFLKYWLNPETGCGAAITVLE